ncbi:VCBS domain-containing protein [Fluviibacterium sp. S390]|uniref:VCBS domain-containing protein n=1 Tax=Fluviibacterium sp. S390 TaxID=3415139 RepID=UPI003C7CACDE
MPGIIYAGTPSDEDIHGTRQGDMLAGSAGDDIVRGRRGDDLLVYDVALNDGATDTYDGGLGLDTIRLLMTSTHWNDPAVQLEIAAYLAFLDTATNGGTGEAVKEFFYFESFGNQTLRVTRVEALEIFVDGQQITPEDDPVTAVDDAVSVDEDGPAIVGNVLDNDSVPDLLGAVTLVTGAMLGTLVLNPDGSYAYALDNANPAVQALNAGETLLDSFTYQVTDANGDTDTATVTVTINGADDGVSGVVDFEGAFYWVAINAEGVNSIHISDAGLQVRGIGDDVLGWYLPAEGTGDGAVYSYDYDYLSATYYEGKGRIEGEGGTGTFSLKSLDIETFRDHEGDGWSVTFTGSNGATQTVTYTGTGSETYASYGTVNFAAVFTDVAWVDWDFTGNVNGDGTPSTDLDYFTIDNLIFEDLQGATPYASDPNVIEFDRGQNNQLYIEDGFTLFATSEYHHVANYDGSDADWEAYLYGNSVHTLDRGDGGSFDLESLYIARVDTGVTFTASNGATHTVAAGATGTTTFGTGFHDITSLTITNGNGYLVVDDITFANIEVV